MYDTVYRSSLIEPATNNLRVQEASSFEGGVVGEIRNLTFRLHPLSALILARPLLLTAPFLLQLDVPKLSTRTDLVEQGRS